MRSPDQRAQRRLELRQLILDAARELCAVEGYAQVSMRKIARRIGYSATTIYLHFTDKADLFDALCAEAFSKLHQRLEAISEPDPLSALRRGLRVYIEFGLEHPQHYTIAFLAPPPASGSPQGPAHRLELGRRTYDLLRRTVQACIDGGQFRPVDVASASRFLWAGAHGLIALLISHPGLWGHPEALIDAHVALHLEGLRRRPGEAPETRC